MNAPNLLKTIQDRRADKVPPDWMTLATMAKQQGYDSVETFRFVQREAIKMGLVESKKFRVMTGRGLSLVPHFRYAKQK